MRRDADVKLKESSKQTILLTTVTVVTILYFAREILIPLALAVLISFLLTPIVSRIQRAGLPRIAAILLVMGVSLSAMGFLGWIVAGQVIDLGNSLPEYRHNIVAKIQALNTPTTGAIGKATENIKDLAQDVLVPAAGGGTSTQPDSVPPVPVEVRPSKAEAIERLQEQFEPFLHTLTGAFITVIFIVFILVGREDLRNRFYQMIGQRRLNITTQALDDAGRRVTRYLGAQLVANMCYGIPVAIGLTLIGVPNAILWGCLGIVLRFIPYLGAAITAGVSIGLSLAVFDGWMRPVETIILFAVLELTIANVIEPWLYASKSGMTPIAVLLSVIFWTWLWGAAGLLLAMPLTVCLVVMGRYVPAFSFLNVLLGDEPTLTPAAQMYQRLLAQDLDEAHQIAEQHLANHSLLKTYDEVLVPALRMSETDRHSGALDEEREAFVRSGMKQVIEALDDRDHDSASESVTQSASMPLQDQRRVLCVPANDEADAAAALMVSRLLQRIGIEAEAVAVGSSVSEFMQRLASDTDQIMCVSVIPPSGLMQARSLCRRIRTVHPKATILMCVWSSESADQVTKRLGGCSADGIVTSMGELVARLQGQLGTNRAIQ
ncbi:MAG TPA: AI-2E family transporter, partial [Phycisphaerales bacterium]|nr:AI-2E family transporter [Phycisphaerales bacterium]